MGLCLVQKNDSLLANKWYAKNNLHNFCRMLFCANFHHTNSAQIIFLNITKLINDIY